jgi:hypothetical protein
VGTKVTKKLFERVVSEEVTHLFSSLGFVETEPGAFDRERGDVVHGFGFTPNPSFTHFHVPVGVNVPALVARTDYLDFGGAHYPTLLVSRWLGELKPHYTRSDIYYHFATVEEMRGKFPQVYTDFVEQAEPWLARLTTVDAVADEFYKWRIAPPLTGEVRPPDPFAWALYGWLLQEAGHGEQAGEWLSRALKELRRPKYSKAGQIVPEGTRNSRLIPPSDSERRLQELLEND